MAEAVRPVFDDDVAIFLLLSADSELRRRCSNSFLLLSSLPTRSAEDPVKLFEIESKSE